MKVLKILEPLHKRSGKGYIGAFFLKNSCSVAVVTCPEWFKMKFIFISIFKARLTARKSVVSQLDKTKRTLLLCKGRERYIIGTATAYQYNTKQGSFARTFSRPIRTYQRGAFYLALEMHDFFILSDSLLIILHVMYLVSKKVASN